MKASDKLIEKIKEFEGFRPKAYEDSGGKLTCGYGTTKGVTKNTTCTREEAERWLLRDLRPVEDYLDKMPEVDTQGKFDALCSWIYNLGVGNFEGSTLHDRITSHAPTAEIQAQIRRWVYCKGMKLPGLVKRREWEARRWTE